MTDTKVSRTRPGGRTARVSRKVEEVTVQLLTEKGYDGLTYKEVASLLHISFHTVADHVKAIYRKLEVNSKSAAIFEAVQAGVIKIHRR